MKLLSAVQKTDWDNFTIENEPVSSIDLMERASEALFQKLMELIPDEEHFTVFCGAGNNGGDGLALTRLLLKAGKLVDCYLLESESYTENNLTNQSRLEGLLSFAKIRTDTDFKRIEETSVVIDAIVGNGLERPLKSTPSLLVGFLNETENLKIAVDAPSGLFSDQRSTEEHILKVDVTITFQVPKTVHLLADQHKYCGDVYVVDIGLFPEFLESLETDYFYTTEYTIDKRFRRRPKFAHKGTFGHALIVAGSMGKMGAAQLAVKACLHSGAGLTSCHIPSSGHEIMQIALPEAMVSLDKNAQHLTEMPQMEAYSSFGIGPGIGTHKNTESMLQLFIQIAGHPIVLDADAINILAMNPDWLDELPRNSILTPHQKEFERLVGPCKDDWNRLDEAKAFARKNKIIIVLKGRHTSVCLPTGKVHFNATGNPGMAKGGSGDVLTGIITGLLAQGYTPSDAAIMGVYLHGRAGDFAAKKNSKHTMQPSDIIESLTECFRELEVN